MTFDLTQLASTSSLLVVITAGIILLMVEAFATERSS